MNFLKVGESFVNLDNVNEVLIPDDAPGSVDVYFAGVAYASDRETLEYNVTTYYDEEAAAILAWLDGIAIDVVEQKRRHDAAEASAERWNRFRALAFAHGVTCASDILTPSFNGTRRAAIYAFSAGQRETFERHAAECSLEADDDAFGGWQDAFYNGVLSAD